VQWLFVESRRVKGNDERSGAPLLPDLAVMVEKAFHANRSTICARYYTAYEASTFQVEDHGHPQGGLPYIVDSHHMLQIRCVRPYTCRKLKRIFVQEEPSTTLTTSAMESEYAQLWASDANEDVDMGTLPC